MLPQPGGPAGRRTISLICAVLAVLAIVGALAFAASPVGNGCGGGLSAYHKPFPSPLLTDAEKAEIKQSKRNPYEAALEKTKPVNECRRQGTKRLITAGLASLIVLLPVLVVVVYIYLYWPRHND